MHLGQHPAPRHTVAHLSDPHLRAAGALQYGVVDPERGLLLALERLSRLDPVPQAIVFTGDLADLGEPAAYRRLRELVEPAAATLGAQVVWVMGNHDERPAFARELLGAESDGPQDLVHEVDGLRVVSLDTSVPGYHHGAIDDAQLDWLTDVLAEPAPHGTVLALHHPPIPSPMVPAEAVIELREQHRLAAVLSGTDVRLILAGHLHFTTHASFAGIPVSVASASCYALDPVPPRDRLLSGVDGGQSFSVTHLYDPVDGAPGLVVSTVVPLAEAPEVYAVSASVREQLLAMTPEQRDEVLSRKDSEFNLAAEL